MERRAESLSPMERRIDGWTRKWARGQAEYMADPERQRLARERCRERTELRKQVQASILPALSVRQVPEPTRRSYQEVAWSLHRLAERHIGYQLASEAEIKIQLGVVGGLSRDVLEQVARVVLGFAPAEVLIP